MWHTREEICAVMCVDAKTLNKLIDENLREEIAPGSLEPITFKDAFAVYSAGGSAAIKRELFNLAKNGNVKALMFFANKVFPEEQQQNKDEEKEVALERVLNRHNELLARRARTPNSSKDSNS